MAEVESATIEGGPNIPVNITPTRLWTGKLWNFSLRLIISFVEALGRSSEEFYVYLPLAHQPRDREYSDPRAVR
jgi:hypothetical protein